MCGLIGGWTLNAFDSLASALPRMTGAIEYRGPDGDGHWLDEEVGVALGHRRLAIVDLSQNGQQPMVSASGRYVIVFNGEIYNHLALRRELESSGKAPRWHGHSDTETLLAGFEAWGLVATLTRCIGMFAIALWDREVRELWMARDRLGEKPLYYGMHAGTLLFGSELKALRAAPGFVGQIDRDALAIMLRYGAIPAPYSIYRGIHKLPPGTWLRVQRADLDSALPLPVAYWSVKDAARRAKANPFVGSAAEAVDDLEVLLGDAIAQQMIADVPLGAFLSGGVDSSTIVALMQARSTRPVKTFTIGFDEPGYNEAEHAEAVARYLGTEHTELYIQSRDALNVIPKLPEIFDEPFADSSQIPTFLVSSLARRHVAVSLSGDAGDELFLGYPRYHIADTLGKALGRVPDFMRPLIGSLIAHVPHAALDLLRSLGGAHRNLGRLTDITPDRVKRVVDLIGKPSEYGAYDGMMSRLPADDAVVIGASSIPTAYENNHDYGPGTTFPERLGLIDLGEYLVTDILTKVDRAAMAVSLETRVPLLDHRVVEFALSLPLSMKWREKQNKWILRQVLYRHVPKAMIERPKMGFGVPIAQWLRGPLREWAETLLDPMRLRQEGYLDADKVQNRWREHLSGSRNWQAHLWNILMFQAWLESTNAHSGSVGRA
jgi:asparagine synthase (glutamine-hydrolysing)